MKEDTKNCHYEYRHINSESLMTKVTMLMAYTANKNVRITEPFKANEFPFSTSLALFNIFYKRGTMIIEIWGFICFPNKIKMLIKYIGINLVTVLKMYFRGMHLQTWLLFSIRKQRICDDQLDTRRCWCSFSHSNQSKH